MIHRVKSVFNLLGRFEHYYWLAKSCTWTMVYYVDFPNILFLDGCLQHYLKNWKQIFKWTCLATDIYRKRIYQSVLLCRRGRKTNWFKIIFSDLFICFGLCIFNWSGLLPVLESLRKGLNFGRVKENLECSSIKSFVSGKGRACYCTLTNSFKHYLHSSLWED